MWIYLFRHGIAWDRSDPMCPPDSERPLTSKGIRRTRAAALGIAQLAPLFERLWVSPYLRAQQTADEASDALGLDGFEREIFDDMVPFGSVKSFMKRVRSTDTSGIFCVGHAPHMDEVILTAIGARSDGMKLKKAGLGVLWYEDGRFKLDGIYPARALRKLGKSMRLDSGEP